VAPGAPPTNDQLVMNLLKERPSAAAPPLRLAPTNEPKRVPTEVAAGYEALLAGNLAGARRGYTTALASDPANLDAQLGLATVEARGGNFAAASVHYRRVLELDPRNATALAGLASLADFSRPGAIEAQLRGDVERNPQSSALRFTLGNLYAAQARWSEAQLEYFEAHRLDPGSADIAFNLAVSLDHLAQRRVAAEYYRRALAAARTRATQFDPAHVERRLAQLGFEPPAGGR
jgi:Tfp pilus assembly protein PilF